MSNSTLAPRPWKERAPWLLISVLFLFAGAAVAGLGYAYFSDSVLTARPRAEVPGKRLARKLILVIHDSLRPEVATPAIMPFFSRVRESGAGGSLIVPGPSLTAVSLLCFGSGIEPPIKTALSNFGAPRFEGEHVLDLASRRGRLRTAFFGDQTFSQLFGEPTEGGMMHAADSLFVELDRGLWVKDRRVALAAIEFASKRDFDFLLLHLTTSDKMAHVHHARCRNDDGGESIYAEAARRQDEMAEALYAAAGGESSTLLLLSDHACTEDGTHGGFDEETRTTVWAAVGPGFRKMSEPCSLRGVELAPLLARLLGARAPAGATGVLRTDLLDLDEEGAFVSRSVNLKAAAELLSAHGVGLAEALPRLELKEIHEESTRLTSNASSDTPRPEAWLKLESMEALAGGVRVAAEQRAARGRRGTVLVLGILLALLLLALSARIPTDSASQRPGLRLLGLTAIVALAFGLVITRDFWLFGLMTTFRWIADVSQGGLAFAIAAALSWNPQARRLPRRLGGIALTAGVLILTFVLTGWPYGPKREFLVVVCQTLFGIGFGSALVSRQRAPMVAAGLGSLVLGICSWLVQAWYTDGVAVAFRVEGHLVHRVLAASLMATHIAIGLGSTSLGWRQRLGALFSFLAIYATACLAESSRDLGFVILGLISIGLAYVLVHGSSFGSGLRASAHLLLVRLFVPDAQFLVIGLICLASLASARVFHGGTAGVRAFLLLLYAGTLFFSQGFGHNLTAFDPAPAYLLVPSRLEPLSAGLMLLLAHVSVAAALVESLLLGSESTRKDLVSLGLCLGLWTALRTWFLLGTIPLFSNEGWYFFGTSHAIVLEALQGALLVIALGIGSLSRSAKVAP